MPCWDHRKRLPFGSLFLRNCGLFWCSGTTYKPSYHLEGAQRVERSLPPVVISRERSESRDLFIPFCHLERRRGSCALPAEPRCASRSIPGAGDVPNLRTSPAFKPVFAGDVPVLRTSPALTGAAFAKCLVPPLSDKSRSGAGAGAFLNAAQILGFAVLLIMPVVEIL